MKSTIDVSVGQIGTHRSTCHRCGNVRKDSLNCSQCPYNYCGRCADKLTLEHGLAAFTDGCPVCLKLCCCAARSRDCKRTFHCYKKCPAVVHTPKNAQLAAGNSAGGQVARAHAVSSKAIKTSPAAPRVDRAILEKMNTVHEARFGDHFLWKHANEPHGVPFHPSTFPQGVQGLHHEHHQLRVTRTNANANGAELMSNIFAVPKGMYGVEEQVVEFGPCSSAGPVLHYKLDGSLGVGESTLHDSDAGSLGICSSDSDHLMSMVISTTADDLPTNGSPRRLCDGHEMPAETHANALKRPVAPDVALLSFDEYLIWQRQEQDGMDCTDDRMVSRAPLAGGGLGESAASRHNDSSMSVQNAADEYDILCHPCLPKADLVSTVCNQQHFVETPAGSQPLGVGMPALPPWHTDQDLYLWVQAARLLSLSSSSSSTTQVTAEDDEVPKSEVP